MRVVNCMLSNGFWGIVEEIRQCKKQLNDFPLTKNNITIPTDGWWRQKQFYLSLIPHLAYRYSQWIT